ncbi:MAG: transcriptional regulator [Bacteroidota bacterium]|jgi:transcriptional regulator with XRE-family HTH domain
MALAEQIKNHRKAKAWTQAQLAERLGLSRAQVGSYEEGRAEPKLDSLKAMAQLFGCSIDALVSGDARSAQELSGQRLRVLTVAVDPESGRERVTVVPVKAAAGYLGGYGDLDFIEALPQFGLPLPEFAQEETRRVFQIQGDSMLPVISGSYVISSYVQDWRSIKTNELYVFLTQEQGVVFKRAINRIAESGYIDLVSDNPVYAPYSVHVDDLIEVWKVQGFIQLDVNAKPSMDQVILARLEHLQGEVHALRRSLNQHVA